jgi:hypothetical protein
MQTNNTAQAISRTEIPSELMTVLEDIAKHVGIRDDFSIHHPQYKPLELPAEAIARFQKMPEQIQQKFLSLQLRSFLYGIYYNGSMRSSLALESDEQTVRLDLENNSVMGIDTAFFQRLQEANHGQGYFDPGWAVLSAEDDQTLLVKKAGLRLYIQREQHLSAAEREAIAGEVVAIKVPKNRMQNGFYVAVSDQGFNHPTEDEVLVRIYLNLTPAGSVAVMASLTEELNAASIPFSFKVLYNPQDYNRYDSGVLYFDARDYGVVMGVLPEIHRQHRSHFLPEIPLFTKRLAVGIGLAEEPNHKFGEQESFGMNRCQMVANGLLKSWQQGDQTFNNRLTAILEQFLLAEISLKHPHLNCQSSETRYHLETSASAFD